MAEIGVEHKPAGVDWSAAIKAGLVGGLIFLVLEMVMVPLFLGGSPWGPPRMIGAIVMGQEVLPPPATFSFGVIVVAMIVHLVLSVVYALMLAFVLARLGLGAALAVGAAFGLLLYLVNFYAFTGIFPWFAMARNWVSIFSHIVFGVLTAWAYMSFARRRTVVA